LIVFLVAEAGGATDRPVWWLFGATVALAVAAWLALAGLLDARETRMITLVSELSRRWDDSLILQALTLAREYGTSGLVALVEALWSPDVKDQETRDLDEWYKVSTYPNLLEAIGAYLAEGVISEDIVYRLWGANVIDAWNLWEEPVRALRDHTNTPEVLVHFEDLAGKMHARLDWERAGRPHKWRRWVRRKVRR